MTRKYLSPRERLGHIIIGMTAYIAALLFLVFAVQGTLIGGDILMIEAKVFFLVVSMGCFLAGFIVISRGCE